MKYTSSKSIVAEILSLYGDSASQYNNAILEFIGRGIESCNAGLAFTTKYVEIDFNNYTIMYPENSLEVLGVFYNGELLEKNSKKLEMYYSKPDLGFINCDIIKRLTVKEPEPEDDCFWSSDNPEDVKERLISNILDVQHSLDIVNKSFKIPKNNKEWYSLKELVIKTSIESGCVTIAYKTFALDEEDYPLILNDYKTFQAIKWYVVLELSLRGLKHPVIDYRLAKESFDEYRHKCRNNQLTLTHSQMKRFVSNWTKILRP